MPLLAWCLYLAAHAALYFIVLRDRQALGSETAIFLYHLISVIAVCGAFGVWAFAADDSDAWTWFACVVAMHGIYSLSFLELWALADDSYSLAIMQIIGRSGGASRPALMHALEAIGARKQASRLEGLEAVGLVRSAGGGLVGLTWLGRVAVLLGRGLLFLANVRKYG